MKIKLKIWFEKNKKVVFGDGRLQILEMIDKKGSLAAASRRLNMSYRAAWGRLRASEKRLGFFLTERSKKEKRSTELTVAGQEIIKQYKELKKYLLCCMHKRKKNNNRLL